MRVRPPPSPPRSGRLIRMVVYGMLVASAAVTVLFGDHLWAAWREGFLPVWAPLFPPAVFTAFVMVYTTDRWLLVRQRRYPLSRALFQVAFALVFLTLLLPQQALELRSAKGHEHELGAREPALLLLNHTDEAVRAAACDLLGGHYGSEVTDRVQVLAHSDPASRVRNCCAHALERLHAAAALRVGAAPP